MLNNHVLPFALNSQAHTQLLPEYRDTDLISSGLLSSFREVVSELGGTPDALLAETGIDPDRLSQPDRKISLRACAELLEVTAQRLGCPDFGLRLAERQNGPSLMKPIGRLLCSAPTLGAVFHHCISHMEAYSCGIGLSLEQRAARQMHFLRIELLFDGLATFPQLTEQLTLLAHDGAFALTAGEARGRKIWFAHRRIGRAVSYAHRFKAPVEFGQAFGGVFFLEADCGAKVVHRDGHVFGVDSCQIEDRYPAQSPGFEEQVRTAIRRALSETECNRRQVAALLRLNTRTLQRRLCRIGLSFEVVRDEVRRSLALRYLAQTDLYVTEIAGRLGYSEPAVLSRSCRRWFAATPSEVRRQLARSGPSIFTATKTCPPSAVPSGNLRICRSLTAIALRTDAT